MGKRVVRAIFFVFFFCAVFSAILEAQYRAEDISVPPGYKVVKVAETNKICDPYRSAFDAAGHLIVAGYGYQIFDIDPGGRVGIIGETRKHNITPTEIEISPAGAFALCSYVWTYDVYVFTPPDTYTKVISSPNIWAIGYDKRENFYAALWGPQVPNSNPAVYYRDIVRYDANFNAVEVAFRTTYPIQDFAFDALNNLFVFEPGGNTNPNGAIIKLQKRAGDGLPGPGGQTTLHAAGLYSATNMAIDDSGNLYLDEYLRTDTDGYSSYRKQRLTKVDISGTVHRDLGPEFSNSHGLACRGNFLYSSENDRGVISKVDLTTFAKTDFTEDFGIDAPGPIAWDNDDNLFTASFRQLRMLKFNSSGTFDQFGPGTGYMQSIAFDGTDFFIGSSPTTGLPMQILKIDPATGSQTQVAVNVPPGNVNGWRSVAFDSFGRLILNSIIDEPQNRYNADIIDLTTGTSAPYLTELHNKGRCIRFDSRQNIYFVEGNGDGIKKTALAPAYSPPRDVSGEPLFYDFVVPGFASPTIYFFAVNPQEELFVPRMDSGDVLFCDPAGNVGRFAEGFIWPGNAAIDRYGSLYISDANNGIFKIIHRRWTIPAVVKLKDALMAEVRGSTIDTGVKNSLVRKLENVDKDLEKEHVTPAINLMGAFVDEVQAQSGKKIPAAAAARWTKSANAIIKALKEVE